MIISKSIKSNQIISIVGATATGKTALALELAEALLEKKLFTAVHLLSADSRQVYEGLENLTGADVPRQFAVRKSDQLKHKFFLHQNKQIFLHGVAIISPATDWSAAHFMELFTEVKSHLSEKDLLIVVGGTGFYQKQVAETAATLKIAPNPQLRSQLEQLSLKELQKKLSETNPQKFAMMNHSDRHNPRRLVRALELAKTKQSTEQPKQKTQPHSIFYLQLDKKLREAKIKTRVEKRLQKAKQEVAQLLKQKNISQAAASSAGFSELSQLIKGEIDQVTCQTLWQLAETQYAKRQDTWWKKQNNLIEIKDSSNLKLVRQISKILC